MIWKSCSCIGLDSYEVSECGLVRGVHTGIIVKQFHNIKGYLRINYRGEHDTKHYLVHRLVAIMWVPNPLLKNIVNHDDEDILFNHRINLRWMTNSENVKYSIERKRKQLIENCPF